MKHAGLISKSKERSIKISRRRLLQQAFGLILIVLLLTGCGGTLADPTTTPTSVPTATSYPTYTPFPTATPYPTYTTIPTATPYPTYTPIPTPTSIGVGEWLDGHFWSIKVIDIQTETELDGIRPTEDVFVLVEVQWKANHLAEKHNIAGIDFELIDNVDEQYGIAGMIYESETFDAYGSNAEFQNGKWQVTNASGTVEVTYRLVFDLPSSAAGLKLWFRNFPLIDLGLDLP